MSERLKVLVIGGGGREHALAWKLAQSPLVEQVFVAPGNGGTAGNKIANVALPADDFGKLVGFAVENNINLVVPGPEQPLVDGVETVFRKVGIPVFGPSAKAAQMEGSKAFSKEFMARHRIPTAAYRVFTTSQHQEAVEYVKACKHRVVLKASGLAAGKGVLIPENTEEAITGLKEIMLDRAFGAAGDEVVVEEYLEGPELSVLAFSDGYTIVPLPAAQDHKRIGEGDTGPNTGGMGAYAPAPIATPEVMSRIMKESLQPTIDGMRREGFPFVGLLFTGFMVTSDGPKVLEYNVRFGDPETEALMLLLDDKTDLAAIMLACAERRLDSVTFSTRPGFAVSVILASGGYPGSYPKGKVITEGTLPSEVYAFHAGTSLSGEKVVTSGGRVIAVAAYAPSLEEALRLAYAGCDAISFEGKTLRRDIGHRALKASREPQAGLTYASAGVSVDAGNDLVEVIKPLVRSTRRPGTDGEIGGFGGNFDLKAIGYKDPILVSGTDGVGTKLRVAIACGTHDTVGIDLVAMSVNDLVVQGAEPLYFLDYYACSKLDVQTCAAVVKGIAEGCKQAGCALVGGETAEMPGMYHEGDYDLAGFAVGAVERNLLLPQGNIAAGDILLGLPSAGVHSNGFSLVRKVLERSGLTYDSPAPFSPNLTMGQVLLQPTRIYVKSVLPACQAGLVKAMSHITGGGFTDNIPRALPKGLGCYVDVSRWELPGVFRWIMEAGNVEPKEMARTFNNGVAMVLVVEKDKVAAVKEMLVAAGEQAVYEIGCVTDVPGVELRGLESWKPSKTA
ncbi:hypothetical protein M407DRAFT_80411 [Tulasnella calospora MUT 4182]|uniref:Phosphoribosylformylglycinamidine cyclo-ligase n=1 Tax=Tulasnella calospora MUT 4182 TaxID=1051891 RepID=A0A0C3Q9R6_9AGAM|nr:hypothetical protein M407DRAFT_80411 [Tulasnella calospora MUT 4182]